MTRKQSGNFKSWFIDLVYSALSKGFLVPVYRFWRPNSLPKKGAYNASELATQIFLTKTCKKS